MVGGWWLVVDDRWLVVGGWWLVVDDRWLVVGGSWLVVDDQAAGNSTFSVVAQRTCLPFPPEGAP